MAQAKPRPFAHFPAGKDYGYRDARTKNQPATEEPEFADSQVPAFERTRNIGIAAHI